MSEPASFFWRDCSDSCIMPPPTDAKRESRALPQVVRGAMPFSIFVIFKPFIRTSD